MIRNVLFIFILGLIAACSFMTMNIQGPKGIDPELKTYLDKFIKESNGLITEKDVEGLRIGFGRLSKVDKNKDSLRVVGQCDYISKENRSIEIDKYYWLYAPQEEKDETMLHELGHCVCSLNHTIFKGENEHVSLWDKIQTLMGKIKISHNRPDPSCPASIMDPVTFGWCYSFYNPYYMKELYEECKEYKK